jgi:hypothetical protein
MDPKYLSRNITFDTNLRLFLLSRKMKKNINIWLDKDSQYRYLHVPIKIPDQIYNGMYQRSPKFSKLIEYCNNKLYLTYHLNQESASAIGRFSQDRMRPAW